MSEQRTVVVTGAAGGLGEGIVRVMAGEGYRVLGVDLRPFESAHCAKTYSCDLTDFPKVRALLDEAERDFGPIKVLVNNAGFYNYAPFFELSTEQVLRTLSVNVAAPLYLSQQVALGMRESGGGAIVNVASIAGRRGSSQVDYGASKAAVINFTVTLARVLAPYNIRMNAVAPALVDAGMGNRTEPHVREAFLSQTPLKRGATTEEIANVIAFLASDKASYVTGETIDVHGGL